MSRLQQHRKTKTKKNYIEKKTQTRVDGGGLKFVMLLFAFECLMGQVFAGAIFLGVTSCSVDISDLRWGCVVLFLRVECCCDVMSVVGWLVGFVLSPLLFQTICDWRRRR
jgi:hypothetical protein